MTQLTQSEHKPYIWLPDSWDAGWRAAKLKCAAQTGTATIMSAGSSASNGAASSNFMTKSFIELLRTNLIGRLGLYADFWPAVAYSPNTPGGFNGTPPWSGILNANGVGYFTSQSFTYMGFNSVAPVPGAFQTFTTPYACTALDIIYLTNTAAGTFEYNVDGGAQQTVNCPGGSLTARAQITGLTNQIHTVTYGWQSNASSIATVGIVTYNPAAAFGLGLSRIAYRTGMANDYNAAGNPTNRVELIQGKTPGNDATNNTGWGFPHQPDLLILEFGIHDCYAATAPNIYQTVIDRFCQAARRGKQDASILFLVPWFGNGLSTDVAPTQSNPANWNQYVGDMYQLAQQYSAGVVNIHARWNSNPLAQGFCNGPTDLHATDAGHADIAAVLTSIL